MKKDSRKLCDIQDNVSKYYHKLINYLFILTQQWWKWKIKKYEKLGRD